MYDLRRVGRWTELCLHSLPSKYGISQSNGPLEESGGTYLFAQKKNIEIWNFLDIFLAFWDIFF